MKKVLGPEPLELLHAGVGATFNALNWLKATV